MSVCDGCCIRSGATSPRKVPSKCQSWQHRPGQSPTLVAVDLKLGYDTFRFMGSALVRREPMTVAGDSRKSYTTRSFLNCFAPRPEEVRLGPIDRRYSQYTRAAAWRTASSTRKRPAAHMRAHRSRPQSEDQIATTPTGPNVPSAAGHSRAHRQQKW
jgi:hypothetical protein